MLTDILQRVPFEVNAEQTHQRIADSRANALALITWLSFPGTAEKHGILDAPYLISMLRVCLSSCAPEDVIRDIDDIVSHVRETVRQVTS